MSFPKIYLAGPVTGYTLGEIRTWRNLAIDISENDYDSPFVFINPIRILEHLDDSTLITDALENNLLASSHGTTHRCQWDVQRCDAVLVYMLDAGSVSIGTVMEIAWAVAYQKPIVVVDSVGSIHDHCMIRGSTPYICSSLGQGVDVLYTLFRL